MAANAEKKAHYEAQMRDSKMKRDAEVHTKELTRKQQKKQDYREAKRVREQEIAEKAAATPGQDAEEDDNEAAATPGETPANVETPGAATAKGPKITGLTGELAIQKAGKKTKKKMLEEAKREEEEKEALKERVKKANEDREKQRI